MAAVPVTDGRTAFRIGRTTDLAGAVYGLIELCPLKIAKVWSIPVLDNRAARGIERDIANAFRVRHLHGAWYSFQTNCSLQKAVMASAMERAAAQASAGIGCVVAWKSVDIGAMLK
ncbi:hypothetical protein [Xanthomonas arboricola]|uniref:hypothetical protein n=1 Tax=Xanthomonas arboricola TaxID=56448 RepID=UPI001ABB4A67|nr:hypothetical protein [Xanthomonas arboricola]NIK50277.1 hypothetical protein [Xanthomonas arboricola]